MNYNSYPTTTFKAHLRSKAQKNEEEMKKDQCEGMINEGRVKAESKCLREREIP